MLFKTVSIVGLGYIGLPTASIFALNKIQVIGVDSNSSTVRTINCGNTHITEPELSKIVKQVVTEGYLKAVSEPEPADAYLIAVPTPLKEQNNQPDLSYIESACGAIAKVLKSGDLIVLESTSPVGTTEQVEAWLAEACPELTFPSQFGNLSDIRIAYCPERVLPGNILNELVTNDRIIGGITEKCSERAAELYKIFVKGECIQTDVRTAEMAKLTENSFRDVNIAFANELSIICDKLNIDVWNLISMANRHPRVNILQPGPGVGGHCIAIDPWFIVSKTPKLATLIREARMVNIGKTDWVIEQVNRAISKKLKTKSMLKEKNLTVAFYGLAFKANIDDLRESPAIDIVMAIAELNVVKVVAIEPNIKALPKNLQGKIELLDLQIADELADIKVLLVDHKEFKNLNPARNLHNSCIIDTRGCWT